MPSINLAPGTQYIVAAQRRRRMLFVASAIVGSIVALLWVGVYLYDAQVVSRLSTVDSNVRKVKMDIAQLKGQSKRVVLFEERLVTLDALLNQHTSYEPVFTGIEKLIPQNTVITNMEINNEEGKVLLSAIVPDSIDQVSQAIASFVREGDSPTIFSRGVLGDVTREDIGGEEGAPTIVRYSFSLELFFDPAVLLAAS